MGEELRGTLGKTEVTVSRLGLGGHTFLQHYGGMDRAGRKELVDIVSTAIDEGINLFDVTYDEERETLGSIMRELDARSKVFLTCWMSKQKTATASDLRAEAERALSLLGIDCIDALYLDWTCTPVQAQAMLEIRDKGLTRFIGLLGTETALSEDIGAFDIVLVNHNYYLRDKESDIQAIRRRHPDTGIISLEPLGRGRFAADETCTRGSLVAPCLKYALAFKAADAVLVAVRRLSQLQEDIRIWKAGEEVTDEELKALGAGRGYGG